ncbi:hypothetical protein BHE74_00045250 [Ensete ventricosum]|uniref:Uncharacterized protein n=1 Tax=Ensete ventricosum TaxID=4639 RepID=A0A426XEQ0_ENSVE|nr:hypothetical protein B296_00047534 [Ensete ventricosum]RWW48657.1 hypothetical protein BHE74_00045250 [Ensete ventricosum]
MNLLHCFSSGTRSQMPPAAGNNEGARALPLAFLMRMAMRVSRAGWFSFLVSNPFNARPWLALELAALVVQVVIITVTMATSRKENPVWPLRIWLTGYNLRNLLSLPLLYWRYRHPTAGLGQECCICLAKSTVTRRR